MLLVLPYLLSLFQEGVISSPRSPGSTKYPDSTECIWEIRSGAGYHSVLEFTGRFDMELSGGCESDYLEIQSYNDITNRLITPGNYTLILVTLIQLDNAW